MVTPVLNRLDVTGCRSQEKRSRMVQAAANVIVSVRHCSQLKMGWPPITSVQCGVLQMPVPVPVWAELVASPALDRAGEAADQARAWGWAERLVRQRLVYLLLARIPPGR